MSGAFTISTPYEFGAAILESAERFTQLVASSATFAEDDEVVIHLPAPAWENARLYVADVIRKYDVSALPRGDNREIVTHTASGRRIRLVKT